MARGKTVEQPETRRKRGAPSNAYLELVREHPLRPIENEAELDRAIAVIDRMLDRDYLDRDERDYLDVLGTLVEQFETTHYPEAPVSDQEMLGHLIEARGTTQAAVANGTGINKVTLSLVLSGKRELTRGHIEALAKHFDVDPGLFLSRTRSR